MRGRVEVGQEFGRLTVSESVGSGKSLCKCSCGNEKIVRTQYLLSGNTKSCGCLKRDLTLKRLTTHGMTHTKLYSVWNSMMARCNNKRNKQYADYGGRGITVCKEWLNSTTFLEWAMPLWKEGLYIDRIDNDKGYSPENCRFITPYMSSFNRRSQKMNNGGYVGVTFHSHTGKFRSEVSRKYLGSFPTIKEAIEVRNSYIQKNGLPHKIQTYNEED